MAALRSASSVGGGTAMRVPGSTAAAMSDATASFASAATVRYLMTRSFGREPVELPESAAGGGVSPSSWKSMPCPVSRA